MAVGYGTKSVTIIVAKTALWVKRHGWSVLAAILGLWSAYNLGLLAAHRGREPLQEAAVFQAREGNVPRTSSAAGQGTQQPQLDRSDTRVVVSKSSTSKKYHHPWCAGAKQIKEANRLWFASPAEAQAAGYTLAGNCTP
jgi:hypothetical protein